MTDEIDLKAHYLGLAENIKKKAAANENERKMVKDKFRPSLVKRSQGRVDKGTVSFNGSGSWTVIGSSSLGDCFDDYNVVFVGGKYACDCQGRDRIGGDVRRRNMCSHIIACMLHKEQNGYKIGDAEWNDSTISTLTESASSVTDARTKVVVNRRKSVQPIEHSTSLFDVSEVEEDISQLSPTLRTMYSDPPQPETVPKTGADQGESATIAQVDAEYDDTADPLNVDPEETWGTVPAPNDPMFLHSKHSVPDWIKGFRESQWIAIQEIMEAYRDGADVVILDAPTGAGKTIIGEFVRRLRRKEFGDRYSAYICNAITLQEQFKRDFPYAKVLKGRANYPTQLYPFPEYTCGDCTNDRGMAEDAECQWCSDVASCAYTMARNAALRDELAVINTAYFLNEANWVGNTSNRDFVIVDECDTLEQLMMGFVKFELSPRMVEELKVEVPKKGSHMTTITEWFENDLLPAFKREIKALPKKPSELKEIRKLQRLQRGLQSADMVARQLMDSGGDSWVRDNDAGPMVLKPIKVDWAGEKYLWQHGKKWLCMSATVISVDEFGESLGLNIAYVSMGHTTAQADAVVEEPFTAPKRPLDYRLVSHPMRFPVENRPIFIAPVADVTWKNKDGAYPRLATAITKLLERYPGERILVHTVSYDLAKYLRANVEVDESREPWHLLVYTQSSEREYTIEKYLNTEGAVLFASSLTRGADFKYDACRVCVVAKVPYLSLGDRQVSTRTRMKGGNLWYAVQTIRELVQATGRGVRSETDKCDTFILDRQYVDNVERRNKAIIPQWWLEAKRSFPTKELM